MRTKTVSALAILSLLWLGTAAVAKPSPHLSAQDKAWLKSSHQVNLAEIKSGQYAHSHAQSQSVRRIGQVLVQDHKMLDSKLTEAAHKLGFASDLPHKPSLAAQAGLRGVEKKQRRAFDESWVAMEIGGHLEAIRKTRDEITHGNSKQVVALAAGALPVLEKHLRLLKKAGQKLGDSG